ncbi:hypothetical protein H9P43_008749 [Blastocladiella emersonii ATCC 22665]|nr:hypothetical protein H9P43_008749 [Blastocladiella emersonii ATCC 22665]
MNSPHVYRSLSPTELLQRLGPIVGSMRVAGAPPGVDVFAPLTQAAMSAARPPSESATTASPAPSPAPAQRAPPAAAAPPQQTQSWYCQPCKKPFSSEKTLLTHEMSTKHKVAVAKFGGNVVTELRRIQSLGTLADAIAAYWKLAQHAWTALARPRDTATVLCILLKLLLAEPRPSVPPTASLPLPLDALLAETRRTLARVLVLEGVGAAEARDLIRTTMFGEGWAEVVRGAMAEGEAAAWAPKAIGRVLGEKMVDVVVAGHVEEAWLVEARDPVVAPCVMYLGVEVAQSESDFGKWTDRVVDYWLSQGETAHPSLLAWTRWLLARPGIEAAQQLRRRIALIGLCCASLLGDRMSAKWIVQRCKDDAEFVASREVKHLLLALDNPSDHATYHYGIGASAAVMQQVHVKSAQPHQPLLAIAKTMRTDAEIKLLQLAVREVSSLSPLGVTLPVSYW